MVNNNSVLNITISDIHSVENSEELINTVCEYTGIPLWVQIRLPFIRLILSTLIYNNKNNSDSNAGKTKREILRTIIKSSLYNKLRKNITGDICFMSTSLGLTLRDDIYYDRLCGYFCDCLPEKTFVWESQYDWNWYSKREFNNLIFHAPLQIKSAVLGHAKVRNIHKNKALEFVYGVQKRVNDILQIRLEEKEIISLALSLSRYIAVSPFLFDSYIKQLRLSRVRLLFKEDGCYGNSATVLAAAHSIGIKTAEFQHGALSPAHNAYNIAPALSKSGAYCNTLPQYFLSYGKWWNKQINVPVKKISVGNPHRTESLSSNKTIIKKKDVLLLLGDGFETDLSVEFMNIVSPIAHAKGYRPVFRPHPFERSRLKQLLNNNIFDIDLKGNIYDSFRESSIVVSEISTGLFEAIELVDYVLIWNTNKAKFNYPEHPFQTFDSAEDFCKILYDDSFNKISQKVVEGMWEPEWRKNYLNFIAAMIGDHK